MTPLEYNEVLGRKIRMDDVERLGVPTQDLVEEALAAGRAEEAIELVEYYHQEMRTMHDILRTWITDLLRYITDRKGVESGEAGPLASQLMKTWDQYSFGVHLRDSCLEAIRAIDDAVAVADTELIDRATDLLDRMRLEFKNPHEVLVAWIQDLLTYMATEFGEESVLESILETHQSIWGDRYESWEQLTPHARLALTVEGMRGGHFSGDSRKGNMTLSDQGDRYKMIMELCGSGGVLRRGDPETGRPPHPVGEHGTNKNPHLWTWKKTGVHWYCTHCCIAKEWLPGQQRGRPFRPLDHVLDPQAPCTWYVYKDEADTRAYHYDRTGLEVPQGAPDMGEGSEQEYPGGS